MTKNNVSLLIKFKKGKPYSAENKEWGILLLDEKPAAKTEPSTKISQEAIVKDERVKVNKEEETRAMVIAAKRRAESQQSEDDLPLRLRSLYEEYKDVMEAKVIRHEWIWERL